MEVPIKEKVDLLLGVNAAAMNAGANFVNSMLFLVNEQKYFASTDGSYIDQDVHRIWAPTSRSPRSTRPPASSRPATACRRRWAWAGSTSTARAAGKFVAPNGVVELRPCPTT